MSRVPSSRASYTLRVEPLDVLLVAIAPFVAVLLRDPDFYVREKLSGLLIYAGISLVVSLLSLMHFGIGRSVSRYLSFYDANQIIKACFCAVVITAAIAFSLTRLQLIPRSLPPIHFLVLGIALIFTRFLTAKRGEDAASRLNSADATQNIIVVGGNRSAWHYIRLLEEFEGNHLNVVAILDDDTRLHGRFMSGYAIIGGPEIAASIVEEYATHGVYIDRLVVAKPLDSQGPEMAELLSLCKQHGLALDNLAERLGVQDPQAQLRRKATGKAAAKPAFNLGRVLYWRVKRLIDIVISGALLILLAPLFLLVALLVAADIGLPVVFWQRRLGRGRRIFHVYKFRSLRLPFNSHGRQLSFNERRSKVADFLRATRIDELPQLYNVFRGDMSLIGPRPLLPVDQPRQGSERLSVRPGLTGWAQVHGGKLITAAEKNALDEWYIRNCSPLVDAKILLLTAPCVFFGDRRDDPVVEHALSQRAKPESSPVAPYADSRIV